MTYPAYIKLNIFKKLKSGSISFKNHFKQLPVPFKIYADFECILKRFSRSHENNGSYTEKNQDRIPCSFAYKVVCVDNKFSKKVVLYKGQNAAYKFIKATLEEYDYCKTMMKKHFNKNLFMSAGYGSHLIIKEVSKFDVKVNAITNKLKKCMAFAINRNLVFIDIMQFMNSSLD